jgi:hypothetical protein
MIDVASTHDEVLHIGSFRDSKRAATRGLLHEASCPGTDTNHALIVLVTLFMYVTLLSGAYPEHGHLEINGAPKPATWLLAPLAQ